MYDHGDTRVVTVSEINFMYFLDRVDWFSNNYPKHLISDLLLELQPKFILFLISSQLSN